MAHVVVGSAPDDISDDTDGTLVDPITPRKKRKCFKYKRNPCSFYQVIVFGVFVLIIIIACVAVETWLHTGRLHEGRPHSIEDAAYHKAIVANVNRRQLMWTAKYNKFAVRAQESSNTVTLLTILNKFTEKPRHLLQDTDQHLKELLRLNMTLPKNFDARTAWPTCWSVHQVANQAGCGSCWAVAATSVMSDRLCIKSNGTKQAQLSALDLTSCCSSCGGCQGTHWALSAFSYWKEEGIVSGGAFGTHEGCRPYSFEPNCGGPCPSSKYSKERTPVCERRCRTEYDVSYEDDLHRARKAYWLRADHGSSAFTPVKSTIKDLVERNVKNGDVTGKFAELLQKELMLHGPVLACFTLNEDFQHYKSGIYSSEVNRSEQLYGHCAKLVGWGVEGSHRYWIYSNTWGRDWGEHGFIRVSFSELPEEVVAGIPY